MNSVDSAKVKHTTSRRNEAEKSCKKLSDPQHSNSRPHTLTVIALHEAGCRSAVVRGQIMRERPTGRPIMRH